MPTPRHPNPYRERSLDELSEALNARAGELLDRTVKRSAEEREELASDTAMLLLALDWVIRPGWHSPGNPERSIANGVHVAFGEWAQGLQQDVRFKVLARAASAVVGGGAEGWIRDHRMGEIRACDLALASDEGLQLVLEHLDEIQRAKKPHR